MPQDTLLPPGADSEKAEKYVAALTDLISQDKVTVTQTDLSRFNSNSMEDHYRVVLSDYDVELSHNKNPDTGEETFIMIFNSISKFDNAEPKPLILSYMHLANEQYLRLKEASDAQIERNRKKLEEERFNQTMQPIDSLLDQLKTSPAAPAPTPVETPTPSETTPAAEAPKPEKPDYLANAQPVSTAGSFAANLTPNAEMQPDPNPVPTEAAVQTSETPEAPAETSAKDSNLPL